MSNALDDLIAAVEAGGDLSADFFEAVEEVLPRQGSVTQNMTKAYSGSLDAALALHNAVLPGWAWSVKTLATDAVQVWIDKAYGLRRMGFIGTTADNPARAWLLAILRAMKEGRNE